MKINKKSCENIWAYLLVGLIIIVLSGLRQPTLRAWLQINNDTMWQTLVEQVNENNLTLGQDLWQFREFYSRGSIYLQKYQTLDVPEELSSIVSFPSSFQPYLLFKSPKIISIEGYAILVDSFFFSQTALSASQWELLLQTNTVQILTNKYTKIALIMAVFDPEVASTANGYLYFDMREELFRTSMQEKKWLVVSLVKLQ